MNDREITVAGTVATGITGLWAVATETPWVVPLALGLSTAIVPIATAWINRLSHEATLQTQLDAARAEVDRLRSLLNGQKSPPL